MSSHIQLNRRQILLAGLAGGIAVTLGQDYWKTRADHDRQAMLEELAKTQLGARSSIDAALEADASTAQKALQIRRTLKLASPQIPYNRPISKLLIQCSKLATQQYLLGKLDPKYDGSIKLLPAYSDRLSGYQQITSLRAQEDIVESEATVLVPKPRTNEEDGPVEHQVSTAEDQLQKTVKEVVKLKNRVPVYFGFVLAHKTHTMIIFRGTQRTVEWVNNFTALQQNYRNPKTDTPPPGPSYGRIHVGFQDIYSGLIDPLPRDIAVHLDPTVPCYIAGHSLGAALATLAAIDVALNVPRLQPRLQLYTYAGPRVGDPVFAEAHSRLIPNSYRVVNLADTIPLTPPTQLRDVYVHVGQPWSFLAQNDDLLPNHVVDTYRGAIDQQAEAYQSRNYLNLGNG